MTGYESKRAMAQDKLAQPEQEPVALKATTQKAVVLLRTVTAGLESALAKTTTPPQRTWVGLTENEIEVIEVMALTKAWAIRMTMAQLREKNA